MSATTDVVDVLVTSPAVADVLVSLPAFDQFILGLRLLARRIRGAKS